MKKTINKILFIFLSLLTILYLQQVTYASSSTTYTMSINENGEFLRTQDAYLPYNTFTELGLKNPDDMIFDDKDNLYIADTGNRRIVILDTINNQIKHIINNDALRQPKGIFITDEYIYVADTLAKSVFQFDMDYQLVKTIGVPDTNSIDEMDFNPNKLVVDNRGNIYIQSEGVFDGIIQLSSEGEFQGYFTSNKVRLSATQIIYRLIFTKEQFEKYGRRDPDIFSNIFIDKDNIIYTTTTGVNYNSIKKHNTQGINMLNRTISSNDARSIYVDSQGLIYAAMESGTIYIYTKEGELIFRYGSSNTNDTLDVSGLFSGLSAVAVDSSGNLWGLDDKKSFLQVFKQTEYANKIYSALNLYESRKYDESIDLWNEILSLNQMSTIAHDNLGKAYLQTERYDEAMHHFKLSGNRTSYSQAFWEVRNNQIQDVLGISIILFVSIFVVSKILGIVNKKTLVISNTLAPIRKGLDKPIVKDTLYFLKVMQKPTDSYYEIKRGNNGSLLGAIIIYITTFLLFINFSINKGFIFQLTSRTDINLMSLVIGFLVITLLIVISNYLDTSINDGLGGIKEIFVMFAYALGPLMIAYALATISSHFLVLDEKFFYNFILYIGYGWSFINMFLGIMEIHQYGALKTIKSLLMMILFSVIIVIALLLLYIMWQQLFDFILSLLKEVFRSVQN